MSITLDVTGTVASNVRVGPSPLAEAMSILHVLTSIAHHPESTNFLQSVTTRLDQDMIDRIWSFSPLWSRLRCRLFFPMGGSIDATWDTEIARLYDLDLETFADVAAEGILGLGRKAGAPKVRTGEVDQFLQACAVRSSQRYELAQQLAIDPDAFRTSLLEFLQECWELFIADVWQQSYSSLARAAELVRSQADSNVSHALQSLSSTATTLETGSVRFDKLDNASVHVAAGPLYIVPSIRGWPHLTIKHNLGLPPVILYPIEEAAQSLSMRQLNLRLAALNSPRRLEICRHLLGEPISTSELAIRLGTSEPQVSRALTQLRNTGLVRSVREAGQLKHHVAADVVKRLGLDLLTTITR